jgi:hypothetical protein
VSSRDSRQDEFEIFQLDQEIVSRARARPGGPPDEVIALGDVRGPVGSIGVRRRGARTVAAELEQVAAHGVPAVALAEDLAQTLGLPQAGRRTEDVADRDGAPEHRGGIVSHRVIGERDEVVVPGEDLRPVGLLGVAASS